MADRVVEWNVPRSKMGRVCTKWLVCKAQMVSRDRYLRISSRLMLKSMKSMSTKCPTSTKVPLWR